MWEVTVQREDRVYLLVKAFFSESEADAYKAAVDRHGL